MRLYRYLTESFINSIKKHKSNYEIFVNPTDEELKSLKEMERGYGYRFIIDTRNKKFYVANAELIHEEMFRNIPELPQHYDYFHESKYLDYIFTGHTSHFNFNKIYSDTFLYDLKRYWNSSTIPNLKLLRNADFSWVNKWINPSKIYKIIDDTIEMLEE